MSSNHENVLRPPSVPTPDWSIGNNKITTSKMDEKSSQVSSFTELIKKQDASEHSQQQELSDPPTLKMTNSNDDGHQTPQRMSSHSIIGSASSHSMASRITGDVALTPTNVHTPMLSNINPHSTMTAMTPAASGADQAKNSIKLQNCVSSVSLGCELKLLEIYCRTRYSEYNPARFQGVVMKIIDPRATALVFRSGKIVCTGSRNEHDSYIAARKFARIIHKLGYPVKFLDFKIQNFCATADLRFPVRLEALQQAHGQFASYEPELFPGLVYRMVRPRVVLLIFVSGKIVFTGGRSRNEIAEALDIIYPILRSYRIS